MSEGEKLLNLYLFGRFRLETMEGEDVSPKSAKSQALLALLATSETGGRGRLWLQKRLWPDKPAEKASTSLRQALSEIRRHLGDHRDLLEADRRSVTLNLEQISQVPGRPEDEFLEGIQLVEGDHGLEEWLERNRAEPVPAPPPGPATSADMSAHVKRPVATRPVVVFQTQDGIPTDLSLIEDIFVDCVARSMRETLSAEVRVGGPVSQDAFVAEVQAFRGGNASNVGIRARVRHGKPETLVWSGMTSTQLHGAPPVEDLQIVSLGNQLIDALAEAMTNQVTESQDIRDANLLTRLAVRRIFSLRPENLLE
ncbi:MAG: hypothetical protein AAGF55_06195, partial [Pseudomonadota bacterium]